MQSFDPGISYVDNKFPSTNYTNYEYLPRRWEVRFMTLEYTRKHFFLLFRTVTFAYCLCSDLSHTRD